MGAASLPDELWRQILESGVHALTLNHKDLCCLSISCRRLHRLSLEDSLWSHLLSSHFPDSSSSSSSSKFTYRVWYEREKERKAAAQRRAVLRKESRVLEHRRKVKDIEMRLVQENQKLRSASMELGNLLKVRQASVALNVWQPEVIRGRQKQIVEQCVVPVESRVHLLEMEVKLCRQQISGLNKAYRDEKRRHEMAKEELMSLKYHPLRDYHSAHSGDNDCERKRKKLKKCITSEALNLFLEFGTNLFGILKQNSTSQVFPLLLVLLTSLVVLGTITLILCFS